MAQASRVVAEVLELLKEKVIPGVTTEDLDRMAEEAIRARGRYLLLKDIAITPRLYVPLSMNRLCTGSHQSVG